MEILGHGNESSLHSAVKNWLARPGDLFEVNVEGYIVDIVRDGLLIEVQTGNFSSVKKKINNLIKVYPVRLVYPLVRRKWIVYVSKVNGEVFRKRRSPKHGRLVDLFDELVRFPSLMATPSFELEVLLVDKQEVRCADGRGSWRRRGVSILDHRLVSVVSSDKFLNPEDFIRFLPKELEKQFTSKQLAKKLKVSLRLARRITYSLRHMGILKIAGKNRQSFLYEVFEKSK